MSDARELLEQTLETHASLCGSCDAGLPMSCTCGDPRQAVVDLSNALRAVLDKCDGLDQTDHPVARAFAREFRDLIASALAGDPR